MAVTLKFAQLSIYVLGLEHARVERVAETLRFAKLSTCTLNLAHPWVEEVGMQKTMVATLKFGKCEGGGGGRDTQICQTEHLCA